MSAERIPIASDHAGFAMKEKFVQALRKKGFEVDDKGARTAEPSDYPDYARLVASEVSSGSVRRGVLLCGSGIGMDIVANRYRGVRAALAWNRDIAKLSRQHNDSNILVVPARFISDEEGIAMLESWLTTDFEGGRHTPRVEKIDVRKGGMNGADWPAWGQLPPGDALREADPQVAAAVEGELRRQSEGLELIASENFVSPAVMEAMGTPFTNKYAEGYPGKRYYGGCEYADVVEQLAIDRAKQLFGADHANVQPHSGAQANAAVYFTFLKPGDTFLGMNLSHGGHLTHGSPVNFSGMMYNATSYGVRDDNGMIDYDAMRDSALQHKPRMIIAGASAYARTIDFAAFASVAKDVGAYFMVDMAHIAGLVAAGIHPSPVPHADAVTSTTHKTLRGPRGGLILCKSQHARAIDKSVFPGLQGGPLVHVIAAKAVAFGEALKPGFGSYCRQVVANARILSSELVERGFNVVSGGTDTHLLLVDLRNRGVTGKAAEKTLDAVGITVNKNTVPRETESPFVTSGIRIGTPAVTTRGMREAEMRQIAALIEGALASSADESALKRIRAEVRDLALAFPLYRGIEPSTVSRPPTAAAPVD